MSPGNRVQRVEQVAAEQAFAGGRLQGDNQVAGAAELVAEPLVLAVYGMVQGEPGGQVVVDAGDIGARREQGGAEEDQRGQDATVSIDEFREPRLTERPARARGG